MLATACSPPRSSFSCYVHTPGPSGGFDDDAEGCRQINLCGFAWCIIMLVITAVTLVLAVVGVCCVGCCVCLGFGFASLGNARGGADARTPLSGTPAYDDDGYVIP